MGGRSVPLTALLVAGGLLTTIAWTQERSAPAGAVAVRSVQVREVRVDAPAPSQREGQRSNHHQDQRSTHHQDLRPTHREERRASVGEERPVDPAFISRPLDSAQGRPVPRPQPRVSAPRRTHTSVQGKRSFYTFKPRFNAGFGVVVGYPVVYPYAYPYVDPFSVSSASYNPVAPSRNTYSNVEAASSSVTAASPLPAAVECDGSVPCGGVSFDITPANAQVSVDGVFIGAVEEFTATSAPLLLAPGDHYIEVRLAGYRTAALDVTIASGEVTPYQGTLERLRLRRP